MLEWILSALQVPVGTACCVAWLMVGLSRGVSVCVSDAPIAVTPVAELVDEPRMGRRPIELASGPGGAGALIEQEDFGEVVAQACPRLVVGAGDRSWGAGGDRGRLGQLAGGRVRSIADH